MKEKITLRVIAKMIYMVGYWIILRMSWDDPYWERCLEDWETLGSELGMRSPEWSTARNHLSGPR